MAGLAYGGTGGRKVQCWKKEIFANDRIGWKVGISTRRTDLPDLAGDARFEAFGLKPIEPRETRCGPKVRHPEAQALYGIS